MRYAFEKVVDTSRLVIFTLRCKNSLFFFCLPNVKSSKIAFTTQRFDTLVHKNFIQIPLKREKLICRRSIEIRILSNPVHSVSCTSCFVSMLKLTFKHCVQIRTLCKYFVYRSFVLCKYKITNKASNHRCYSYIRCLNKNWFHFTQNSSDIFKMSLDLNLH